MTEPITLSTGGPFTPEYLKQVAATTAEAIRVLNHATLDATSCDALRFPADADYVLCELASMAQRLPQLLGQLARWLQAQQDADRIRVTYGTNEGRPDTAVADALGWLGIAQQNGGDLYEALNCARQLTAAMSAPYDPAEDDDA